MSVDISLENLERFKQNLDNSYGQANNPAKLDSAGKVPSSQLPSDVYNIVEYNTFNAFPPTGEAKKIYIDTSTNDTYRWNGSAYVSISASDAVKYVSQTLTTEQKQQARINIGALAESDLPSDILRYTEQELTEAQQQQARSNISALAEADLPSNILRYSEQELTEEQQQQARENINALGVGEIPDNVVTYSEQSLEPEEKAQARTNIGAASSTEVSGLSDTVADLNNRLNNFGNFVRKVEEDEAGIKVTYDNNQIDVVPTGLVFNGGYVDDNNYLYLKQDDQILPNDVFEPVKLPEGGGGGGSAIALSDVVKVNTVRNGEDAVFSFVATASDASDITVKWFVNNTLHTTQIKESGETFSFNAGEYLTPSDTSSVKALVESGSGSSLSRSWSVTSVAFSISWGNSINPIMLYTTNDNIYVPINVSAEAGMNTIVSITVGDGVITKNATGSMTLNVELNKTLFQTGKNIVTASMANAEDPDDKAEDIHFTVIWGYGATSPVVAFANNTDECDQYDVFNIEYFVFDPENETAECSLQIGSDSPIILLAQRRMQTYQYSPLTSGTIVNTLRCGSASATMTLTVNAVSYNLDYYKDDSLQYDLNPIGHSNTDADRESFAGLTFSENFDWENGGFQNDSNGVRAFVVKKGSSVILPRSLFSDSDVNGKTVDISFKITNSDQYDAVAMRDMNNGATKGIVLKANNGELYLNNIAGQEFRYCEESRIDISILVENNIEQRISTIWLDGIPSKADAYTANMLVQNESNMVVGSEHCDVWLYAIRVYNAQLTRKQMMQNYVSCGNTTQEKVSRYNLNTILDTNDKITLDALHTAVPNLTIVHIHAPRMTVSKEDPVSIDAEIIDGSTVLELSAEAGTVYKVQGTSSAAYGRSSYNVDIDFKGTGKKYKISENSIPVNYLNIKVNVASSENANNINAVDWYNTFQPYITESRLIPGVRDTVEGKPCAVFITNTSNETLWFSSQLVEPNKTILYAMGDLCNSKKNKNVFGEDGSGEHPTKACIEVSGNDTEPQRFRSTAAVFNPEADDGKGRWETVNPETGKVSKEFEWRMNPSSEDLETIVSEWDRLVAWVVSTIDDSAKFKREVGNYFAIQSLLYHFLFIEYFACYDNISKNTFYSYDWDETAGKYLWNIKAAYDMDTILACDNDGKPYGDYGLDFGDTENGRSYFNAADNPIWVNIQSAFQNELSSLYVSLRTAGAWDANALINKWNNYQVQRPQVAMMTDAYNKYVLPYKTAGMIIDGETKSYDNSYLPRMQGSKTYWRKQFLTYQTAYMDGKYGYYSKTNSMQFRTNCESGTRNFSIKAYAKTYVTLIVDDNKVGSQKVNAGEVTTFNSVSVGTNTTLYATPDRLIQYVRPLNTTENSTFTASGATKLTEALLGGDDINMSWPSGTGVSIPSVLLKDISIRNMQNFSSALNLSQNVELVTVDTRNTKTGFVMLPSFAPVSSIQLNACTGIEAYNLHKVETFTMENGNNLESIILENCNDYFNLTIAPYITQAAGVQIASTRRIRAIMDATPDKYDNTKTYRVGDACIHNDIKYQCSIDIVVAEDWNASHWIADEYARKVNWSFDNLNVLYKIATQWKGYNNLGEEQDKPVVTGCVHVTSLSMKKLEAIHDVWGTDTMERSLDEVHQRWVSANLIITYDAIIPYYAVSFKNIDDTAIKDKKGNDYIQYVDRNDEAYDPIEAGEVNIPTYVDPAGQYAYTFNSWSNLTGPVIEDKEVTAVYDQAVITYRVRWFDKPNGTLYDIRENVPYGDEAVYDPEGTIGFPVNTEMEPANIYNVFNGWDKSTGFVRTNIDVYARWIQGQMPTAGTNLKDMNVAQIYGITKNNRADSYFNDEDYTDIQVGRDFNFDNVQSEILLTERYFNGSEIYRTNIPLFSEDAPSFTLAVDYEFCEGTSDATLISCCDGSGSVEGFRVKYYLGSSSTEDQSVQVSWGDKIDTIAHGLNRGILVLRHKKGSNSLLVASDNGGRYVRVSANYGGDEGWSYRYAGYNSSIHYSELPRVQQTVMDYTLSFGAIAYGTQGYRSPAKGWIHWAKIWYDDIGSENVRQLASWPRETWRMRYRGHGIYNKADVTGDFDSASFIADTPLSQFYEFYPESQRDTTGSWKNSTLRSFVNSRCFNAMPYCWQAIIQPVNIVTKGGADNPNVTEDTVDKLYVPSYADVTSVTTGLISAEGRQVSWFINDPARAKFMGITVSDSPPITDATADPTLYTDTYHVKEGDVWINRDNQMAYVYVSEETYQRHAVLCARPTSDTTNNIVAAGTQGGLWVRATSYWTRTNQNSDWQFIVYPAGTPSNTWVNGQEYQRRGVVLMFSL